MKLQEIDVNKQREVISIEQGKELLKDLTHAEIQKIWRDEDKARAAKSLKESGYKAHYDYDRRSITVSSTHETDGSLTLIFSAKYVGTDLDLICDCLAEHHSVYYRIENDSTITWVGDQYQQRTVSANA